jgi:ABC-type amino acid transport substrate-binding protein
MNIPKLVIQEKPINILMLESPPFSYKNELGQYAGFEYEIVKYFVDKNKLKANFIFISDKESTQSYTEYVQDVANGKYDLAIGNITQTLSRSEIVNFSSPLYFDMIKIFYLDKNLALQAYYYSMIKVIIKFIAVILIVGFIIAFIHYYSSNFRTTFKASLWRVWAALLGEPGLGVHPTKFNENVNRASLINLGFRAILILLSALFGIYLGAIVTSERVAAAVKDAPFSTLDDLRDKTILTFEGTSHVDRINAYSKMFNVKAKTIPKAEGLGDWDAMTQYFLKNKDKEKLDGIMFTAESFRSQDKDNVFFAGKIIFTKKFIAVPFNTERSVLLKKFNQILLELREKKIVKELCNKYFKEKDICLQ